MARRVLCDRSMDHVDTEVAAALERGDVNGAAALAHRVYGAQILGYLARLLHDADSAGDAFGQFAERLLRGLPGFRGASSLRTWLYKLAWSAAQDVLRDPYRRRAVTLATSARSRLAAPAPSSRARRPDAHERLAQLRRKLRPCEQTLLVLRIDRGMSWREIADVLGAPSEEALRQRFRALKQKLRRLVDGAGEAA